MRAVLILLLLIVFIWAPVALGFYNATTGLIITVTSIIGGYAGEKLFARKQQ